MALLALNVIVGPGCGADLDRLMASIPAGLCDEVVIVPATTAPEPDLEAQCQRYSTVPVSRFVWCDDFSAARNFCLSLTTADYVLWCDSDDYLLPEDAPAWLAFRDTLPAAQWDYALVNYAYNHNPDGSPTLLLPRERIVRRSKMLWQDEVHEYIKTDNAKSTRTALTTHHAKHGWTGDRNQRILAQMYAKRPNDPRVMFYFGREMAELGHADVGIPVLERLIRTGEGFADNIVVACIKIAFIAIEAGQFPRANVYACIGQTYSDLYAELDVAKGLYHESRGELAAAESCYRVALSKTPGTAGMSQLSDYYRDGSIAHGRLAFVYSAQGKHGQAKAEAEACLAVNGAREDLIQVLSTLNGYLASESIRRTVYPGDITAIIRSVKSHGKDITVDILETGINHVSIKAVKPRPLSLALLCPNTDMAWAPYRIRYKQLAAALHADTVSTPDGVTPAHSAVWMAQGTATKAAVVACRSRGAVVVVDLCEMIVDDRTADAVAAADLVTVASIAMEQTLRARGVSNVLVIRDPLESITAHRVPRAPRDKPVALYLGYGGNSWMVTSWLRPAIEAAGWQLRTCTEWADADTPWSLDTWQVTMYDADAILIPQRVSQQCKSNNRLTQAMAFGLPVIASPIPAYLDCTPDQGVLYANGPQEWKAALESLKTEDARKALGARGQSLMSKGGYFPETIAIHLRSGIESVLRGCAQAKTTFIKRDAPAVDIIIPVYNNVQYLKLCLESIWLATETPARIIVSDAGSNAETWEYLRTVKTVTVLGSQDTRLSFAAACNAGILASSSKYFVLLNSDTVVSRGWLESIVSTMDTTPRLACCGPLSNCDVGFRHAAGQYNMTLESGVTLHPGMKYGSVDIEELRGFMLASNQRHKGQMSFVDWVAAYAAIYARGAVNEVGLLDTRFVNGCEDLDLSRRLSAAGYKHAHDWGAFVFHFGGVSRYEDQQARRTEYDAEDSANHTAYDLKWQRKRLAIWTGKALEPWGRAEVMAGMAGSETWACMLAEEFARRGWEVTVYGDTRKAAYDENGVRWVHHDAMLTDIEYRWFDHFICSRYRTVLPESLHAGKVWMMIHDVCPNDSMGYGHDYKVAGYACLSEWHRGNCVADGMPASKIFLTHNGIDAEEYARIRGTTTKRNMMVWSSSPDRGLYQFLNILPRIVERVPDFELIVTYGFFNWEEASKSRKDTESIEFIDRIKARMAHTAVTYLGRVGKLELAKLQCESKVWVYPTWFHETFCISAVENAAAGNALVYSDIGGLKTTIGGAGIVIPPEGIISNRTGDYPDAVATDIINATVSLLTDEERRQHYAALAAHKTESYTWGKAADGWIAQFDKT